MTDKAGWIRAAVDQFERPLITYALRMTGELETARDVVQDTFLKLWLADQAGIEDHLAPWLYRVCRNRALDVLRKEGRMTTFDDDRLSACAPKGTPQQDNATGDHTLLDSMRTLPARQQEILRLKFQGGLTYKQIAEVMDLTASNVGFLIHTSIKALRDQLAPHGDQPGEAATGAAR
ncbi:MAG: sigma-70 family RNA polymerase sigma factor [Planctomycetota bacterium]